MDDIKSALLGNKEAAQMVMERMEALKDGKGD